MSDAFYEIVEFVFESEKSCLIWCSPDKGDDHFENYYSRIVAFRDENSAAKFLASKGITAKKTVYDFDTLDYSKCEDFLGKWNIIDDLSKSISSDFLGNDDKLTTLYSKFVYGSNFPALNTSGKVYTPSFDKEELAQIEEVKSDMLRILKMALSNANFSVYYDFAAVKKQRLSQNVTLANGVLLFVTLFVLLVVNSLSSVSIFFLFTISFLISSIVGTVVSNGWRRVLNVIFLLLGIALTYLSLLLFLFSLIC